MKYLSHVKRGMVAFLVLALSALLAGCGTNDKLLKDDANYGSTGSANFSSYVAIGNSLTAGYQSAALLTTYSQYSFPKLIAEQAGVTTFVQPDIASPGLGAYTAQGLGVLQFNPATFAITPTPLSATQAANPSSMLQNPTYPAPYNNLGIPGALSVQVPTVASSSDAAAMGNTMFNLVLRGQGTVVQQALALQPTFATVWLGSNDILGWATTGGTQAGLPIPTAQLKASIEGVVTALIAQNNCKVALANLTDINGLPFFTTVPTTVSGNALIGPDGALAEGDMIVMSAKSYVENGYGSSSAMPLTDAMVLNVAEQATVASTIAEYNAAIQQIADAHPDQVVLVDMNTIFDEMAAGHYYANGVRLLPKMVTGGLFSLDGVHPNTIGYGIIANAFIEAINEKWGGSIPLVDLVSLQGK